MPIPLGYSIAALILGSALKWKSHRDSVAKQKQHVSSDLALRKTMADRARAAQSQVRDEYQRPRMEAAEQAEGGRLAAVLNRGIPVAPSPTAQVGAPRVVREAEAADRAAAADRARSQGQQMAAMMALGNALNALQPNLAGSAVTTGVAADAMRGSAGVLPLELQQAKLMAYSPIGDILSNLGSYGMSSAIQNKKFS